MLLFPLPQRQAEPASLSGGAIWLVLGRGKAEKQLRNGSGRAGLAMVFENTEVTVVQREESRARTVAEIAGCGVETLFI